MSLKVFGLFAVIVLLFGAASNPISNLSFAQTNPSTNSTSVNGTKSLNATSSINATKVAVQNKTAIEKAYNERQRVLDNDKKQAQSVQDKVRETLEKIKNEREKLAEQEKKALQTSDKQNKRLNEKLDEQLQKKLEREKAILDKFRDKTFKPNLRDSKIPSPIEKQVDQEEIYAKYQEAQKKSLSKKDPNKIPADLQKLIEERQKAIEKARQKSETQSNYEPTQTKDKIRTQAEQKTITVQEKLKGQQIRENAQKEYQKSHPIKQEEIEKVRNRGK